VVYDADDCKNPTGDTKIAGLTTAEISEVQGPSEKEIHGKILCNYVYQPATPGSDTPGDPSHGGSSVWTGTYASIPGLVE